MIINSGLIIISIPCPLSFYLHNQLSPQQGAASIYPDHLLLLFAHLAQQHLHWSGRMPKQLEKDNSKMRETEIMKNSSIYLISTCRFK